MFPTASGQADLFLQTVLGHSLLVLTHKTTPTSDAVAQIFTQVNTWRITFYDELAPLTNLTFMNKGG